MTERCGDWNWTISKDAAGGYSFDAAHLAVLMDIRAELKRLNSLLHCVNFQRIPAKLERIARNTAKPRAKMKRGKT